MSKREEVDRFPFFWLIAALILLQIQVYGYAQAQTDPNEGRFGKLEKDETWSGTVVLTGDIYIPPDHTLIVKAGSTINPSPGKSVWDVAISRNIRGAQREVTRRGLVDIIVEGTLRLEGQWLSGISVADLKERRPASWGGIVVINKGKTEISRAAIFLADTALALFDQSEAKVADSKFKSNLAAIEAFQESSLDIKENTLSANPTGAALYDRSRGRISGNTFRFNTSAIVIADHAEASVVGNTLFKNIVAVSTLDATRPQIRDNYLLANQVGIRLGQSAAPEMDGNLSLFEKRKSADERD